MRIAIEPDVALRIAEDLVVLLVVRVACHHLVVPLHTLLFATHAAHQSVGISHEYSIGHLVDVAYRSLPHPLVVITETQGIDELLLGLVIVESLVLNIHPYVLPVVEEDEVGIQVGIYHAQSLGYAAVETLGAGVKDDVATAGTYPQVTVVAFLDAGDVVVGQRTCTEVVALELTNVEAVKKVQSSRRAYPHKTTAVLADGVYLTGRKSFRKSDILEPILLCSQHSAGTEH